MVLHGVPDNYVVAPHDAPDNIVDVSPDLHNRAIICLEFFSVSINKINNNNKSIDPQLITSPKRKVVLGGLKYT